MLSDSVVDILSDISAVWQGVLAIAAPVVAVLLTFSAGRVTGVQRWFLFAPVRWAARRLRTEGDSGAKEASKAVRGYLARVLENPDEDVAGFTRSFAPTRYEESAEKLLNLGRIATEATVPGRRGVVARALWPVQFRLVNETLITLRDHVANFHHLAPMAPQIVGSEFAVLVSAYSGASVLADGVGTTAGVMDHVRIWHRPVWTGPDRPHPEAVHKALIGKGSSPYDERHLGFDTSRLDVPSTSPVANEREMRVGDYDGRIFDLRAVRPRIDERNEGLAVVLETHESCYLLSEASEEYAGKHLSSQSHGPLESRTGVFEPDGLDHSRVDGSDRDRIVIVATSLTLISHGVDGSELILAKRGAAARNATGVVSATSGGVFELGRGLSRGDVDAWGNPDPLACVLRETEEELGLSFEPSQLAPVAVVYSNVQGRGESSEGQLGATIAYLAHTELDQQGIQMRRLLSSHWSKGRFELDGFTSVSMPRPDSTKVADKTKAAHEFLAGLHEMAGVIDQNAVISSLYATAHMYGVTAATRALRALPEPWWASSWADEAPESPRLVRDPRLLAPGIGGRLQAANPTWSGYFARFDSRE